MIGRYKKDYLQRLIEELFEKLQLLHTEDKKTNEAQNLLQEAIQFFAENFDVKLSDSARVVAGKIENNELLEQYAKLILIKYEITNLKDTDQLYTAFSIVEYLDKIDSTYSWTRTVLREDLLRLLDESAKI